MMRYHTKYRDTIRYDTIRNCLLHEPHAVSYNLEQHRSAYQHCRRSRCLDTGRPARRQSAGGRFLWSPGSFSRATVSTFRQTIAAVETLHGSYCLGAAQHGRSTATRPAGGRMAQIFSDCAITKYLSRATTFTVNTSTHPIGQAITAN